MPDPAPLLGCIADDLTGATDLGLVLQTAGLPATLAVGVPDAPLPPSPAIVIALKTRTIAPEDAVAQSLAAARRLVEAGAGRLYFKYCSTFDSTDRGNIGPVIDALAAETGASIVPTTPAFPATGRRVFCGHLFVGTALLSDSPMRDHPLTPMRDANLVRVLGRQSRATVGLVPSETVVRGPAAIAERLAALRASGAGAAILDAVDEDDLVALGEAVVDLPLTAGASGLAMGLARALARGRPAAPPPPLPRVGGPAAIMCGSCSEATRRQVAAARAAGFPAIRIDPLALAAGSVTADGLAAEAVAALGNTPVLAYATAEPAEVAAAQARLGIETASALVESALAAIAEAVWRAGVRRLVVAGGESSGAVILRLALPALAIGPQIAPGVPWTFSLGVDPTAIALKSGNFGADDFFLTCWDSLP